MKDICDNCFWNSERDQDIGWCDLKEDYVTWNHHCVQWKDAQDLPTACTDGAGANAGISDQISYRLRPLTNEEKEEHPDLDYILECNLPYDAQRILVNIKYK